MGLREKTIIILGMAALVGEKKVKVWRLVDVMRGWWPRKPDMYLDFVTLVQFPEGLASVLRAQGVGYQI